MCMEKRRSVQNPPRKICLLATPAASCFSTSCAMMSRDAPRPSMSSLDRPVRSFKSYQPVIRMPPFSVMGRIGL